MVFFDREEVGGLTSRLGADCQQLSNVLGNNIHLIVRNTLQGLGALINLLMLSWPLALSSIITCSALAAIFLLYGRYQKVAAKLTQDLTASASEAAEETLSSIRTIRVYGTENEELGRYKHWLERLSSLSLRESVAYGCWNTSFSILFRSTQVFALLLGGMSIRTGHVSTEDLTKYVLYCEWLIYATWRIVENTISLLRAVGSSERVFQLMQLSCSDQILSKGTVQIPILENFNLSVKANEVIALVGPSGSGKTTLVNLLLRLYEPNSGQIYVDGYPLSKLNIRWLREKIGFVGQEPKLFHMDVKSNITYGCGEDITEEEVEQAAKLAHAHDFILALPDGYRTMVDSNLLSGGQKQRIAIARAIIRKPPILVLDEATSALDSQTEHFVKEITEAFISGEMWKTTIIVITHRLSSVKTADRIIVMDGGRIVEMGGHKELLQENGLYSRLVKLQSSSIT
ncbi:ABC transporter B family member 26, chloroplastic [Linum perenne]